MRTAPPIRRLRPCLRLRASLPGTLFASSLALGATTVGAQAVPNDGLQRLISPDITAVTIGAAAISGDNAERSLFSQYRDWRDREAMLRLDLDFVRREEATGTWLHMVARDLGLKTPEFRIRHERQGQWKLFVDFNSMVRNYPRTIHTGLAGAGGTNPIVSLLPASGGGNGLDLQTRRRGMTLGGETRLTPELSVDASLRIVTKEGARLFGRGFNCPSAYAASPVCSALAAGADQWALLMLPEPTQSTTRQLEATLNYVGEDLVLAATYYGSFYKNDVSRLSPTVSGNLNDPLGNPMGSAAGSVALTDGLRAILQQPIALAPDNLAHQFAMSGNFAFNPQTRATFHLAYTHATQNEDFAAMGLGDAPAGRTNLGGVLDTTLAQLGVSTRPLRDLTLLADLRYENKQDKTPLDDYGRINGISFTNSNYSLKTLKGKLEGTWRMPKGMRLKLAADHEILDRGDGTVTDSNASISGFRNETWETGLRTELRKPFADGLAGSVPIARSERHGASYRKPNPLPLTGTSPLSDEAIYSRTAAFPVMFMDRTRDKLKLMTDWSPDAAFSLQATLEGGRDKYSAPTEKGLRDTGFQLISLDAGLALGAKARLSAWYSWSEQTLHVSHASGYVADLKDRGHHAGIALNGSSGPRLTWGADLLFGFSRNIYAQSTDALASAANRDFLAQSGGLPDVTYRNLRLKLFSSFNLDRQSRIRIDLVHDRSHLNEWTWGYNGVPFAYSDNTTVSLQPRQRVTYLSATYTYRW